MSGVYGLAAKACGSEWVSPRKHWASCAKVGSTARAAGLMTAARSQKQRVQTTSDDKDNQCNINGQRRATWFVFSGSGVSQAAFM